MTSNKRRFPWAKLLLALACLVFFVGIMISALVLIDHYASAGQQKTEFISVFGVSPTADHNDVSSVVSAYLSDLESLRKQKLSALQQISKIANASADLRVPQLNLETAEARLAAAQKLAKQFGY